MSLGSSYKSTQVVGNDGQLITCSSVFLQRGALPGVVQSLRLWPLESDWTVAVLDCLWSLFWLCQALHMLLSVLLLYLLL